MFKQKRIAHYVLLLLLFWMIPIIVGTSSSGLKKVPKAKILAAGTTKLAQVFPVAYVTNTDNNTVSVIDVTNNTIIDTIIVGNKPRTVTITPKGTHVYVVNEDSHNVSVIDTNSNAVVATVSVGQDPLGIAITPDGTKVYVTNSGSNTVSVIDTNSNLVSTTISGVLSPYGLAFTPSGSHAYITSATILGRVSIINTSTVAIETTIPVGGLPSEVAITPDGARAYVTNTNDHTVSVIDTAENSVVNTISVDDGPQDVTITPDGTRAYVTSRFSGIVSVIDIALNTKVAVVDVGGSPFGIAMTQDGNWAYVTDSLDGIVSVLSTTAVSEAVVATIDVGGNPQGMAITQPAGRISGKVMLGDGVTPIEEVGILAEGANMGLLEVDMSADDGTYLLEDVTPDTYTVTAVLPGYELIQLTAIVVSYGEQVTSTNFVLQQGSMITGRVTLADGMTTIANASILATGPDGEIGVGVTTVDGVYTIEGVLTPGVYVVEVLKQGIGFDTQEVTIPPSSVTVTDIDFLAYAGVITGYVTELDGVTPIIGAAIQANIDPLTHNNSVDSSALFATTQTGSDGSFRFDGLKPISYTLQASYTGLGTEVRTVFIPDTGIANVDVTLGPAGFITGKVTELDSTIPIAGAQITLIDSNNRVINPLANVVTDQNGDYMVEDLATGTYSVVANVFESLSLVKSNVSVVTGQTTSNVDLAPAAAAGAIAGTIYEANGVTPVETAVILAFSVNADGAGGQTIPAANGTYEIANLPAGEYGLTVVATGFQVEAIVSGITIVAGQTAIVDFFLIPE